jgi:RNA polymerase sigma factor (sigma-70 family)
VSVGSLPNSDSEKIATDVFADFYRQHYPGAVRLAWLLTHDNSMTEDVVQDAFIRLQPRFDEVLDRPAYLRACVVNGCRDRARGEKRSASRIRLLAVTERVASNDRPSELLDAVATLPYNQRAAVVLRYWADLSEGDIAHVLDIRPGTVRTLIARALSALRKDLPR